MNKTLKPTSTKNSFLIIGGSFLTVVGATLLGRTHGWLGLDSETFWPTYLILTGILFLLFVSQTHRSSLRGIFAWFGILTLLLGGFFYLFTYRVYTWGNMAYLWPVIIIDLGIASIASYYAGRGGLFKFSRVPGVILTALGVFLLILTTPSHSDAFLSKFWPLFILIPGVSLLFAGFNSRKKG